MSREIEGHRKLQFKNSAEASKAYQRVKKIIKKTEDENGVLVLMGSALIIPRSIVFNPDNATEA